MPTESSSGKKPTSRRYSPEEKAAAVRMVRALRAELGTEQGTVSRVARQLGYGVESVRSWVRQADIDDGYAPGVSTAESQRVKELEQESRELKRANVIESSWKSWRLLTLETRMESCRRNSRQGSRRRGGTARRRRPPRCRWCALCVPIWAPITGRCTGLLVNSAMAWNRCGPGPGRHGDLFGRRASPMVWALCWWFRRH